MNRRMMFISGSLCALLFVGCSDSAEPVDGSFVADPSLEGTAGEAIDDGSTSGDDSSSTGEGAERSTEDDPASSGDDSDPTRSEDPTGTPDDPDGAEGESEDSPSLGSGFVAFSSPEDNSKATGTVQVNLVPVGYEELKLTSLEVSLGETIIFRDTKLPTEFHIDTRSLPNGTAELMVTAQDGPDVATDTVRIESENPTFGIQYVTPSVREVTDGQSITLRVVTDAQNGFVTADFQAIDSNFQASNLGTTGTDGKFDITYTISADNVRPDGLYPVPVLVSQDGQTVSHDLMHIALRNKPVTPFTVTGGIFVDEPLPLPDATWLGSKPEIIGGNDFIITGGSAAVDVEFFNQPFSSEVIGLIVGLENWSGYYQIPLDSGSGQQQVLMLLRSYLPTELPPISLPIRFALRDVKGRVSPYAPHQLTVKPVGSGDIQVSVSWDTATDVDLHVVEPQANGEKGGEELYYGNKDSASGGILDLDSNPACSIDGINNENVYWPSGAAPEGTYIVRVDFFSDCCNCGANYTVTINNCGSSEVHQGEFLPNTDDSGGAGSGVTVAEFANTTCTKRLVGRIRYEDRTFDNRGFDARTLLPARHVTVELKRAFDGLVLGRTVTDRTGYYEIPYNNEFEFAEGDLPEGADPDELYIEVSTKTDPTDGLRDITVMNHPKFKVLYLATSETFSGPGADAGDEITVFDMDVLDAQGSGAFNVFDTLVRGHDLVRLMTGKDLGEIKGFWMTGVDSTETLFCSEYLYNQGLCTEIGSVSVRGANTDRDEFDDMVILKEFFKLVTERLSRDDNPGGLIDGTRVDPRQAWTEGVSTFFASDTLASQYFINGRPQQGYEVYEIHDLETMLSPFAFKAEEGLLTGRISDRLVSGLLWDLADTQVNEVFDGVHGVRNGIYDALFIYFNLTSFADRGVEGADLVDFLDGWFCRGWSLTTEVEDLVVNHRAFPYDFAGPVACQNN